MQKKSQIDTILAEAEYLGIEIKIVSKGDDTSKPGIHVPKLNNVKHLADSLDLALEHRVDKIYLYKPNQDESN